jgi:hypothetical protein
VFCGECGAEIEGDPKFCPVCGTPTTLFTVKSGGAKRPRPRPKRKVPVAKRPKAGTESGSCPLCRGMRMCHRCDGTGECRTCNGTGRVGRGVLFSKTCRSCMGSGKCHVCKGTKECSLCKGTGQFVDDGIPWS